MESYSDESYEDKALIWPVSSKLQVELYGMRVNDMLNMHYYGSLEIKEHDMINYEGVAYKVVSIQKFKRFKAIGIEKNMTNKDFNNLIKKLSELDSGAGQEVAMRAVKQAGELSKVKQSF